MGTITIIACFIFITYFLLKIVIPFLDYLSNKFQNTFFKKLISFITILIMIGFYIFVPVIIIRKLPRSKEQIANRELIKFRELGNKYKIDEKYDLAYNSYDSAEQYSNKPFSFHFEKSEMKFMKGEIREAISIISKLINFEENKNSYSPLSYEQRSMYFFKNSDFENAIEDLKKAKNYDANYPNDWNIQISLMYFLLNNVDSSQSYVIKAENSFDTQNEEDRKENLKEQNLLKSLIYLKKNDNILS